MSSPEQPYRDESLSRTQLALLIGGFLLLPPLCLCGGCWAFFETFTIEQVSVRGHERLLGPDGDEIEVGPNRPLESFPATIAVAYGTEYGGEPTRTVDGNLFVAPDQNCRVADPMDCDRKRCRGTIRVSGPGLCAYRIELVSEPGGSVRTCHHEVFATSSDRYRRIEREFAGAEDGPYDGGLSNEASDRCYPNDTGLPSSDAPDT